MSVYVDSAFIPYQGMLMSHMLADTPAELHSMATLIGVNRRWFQGEASTPHYDVCKSKREAAIRYGAKVISRGELVALIKKLRTPAERKSG